MSKQTKIKVSAKDSFGRCVIVAEALPYSLDFQETSAKISTTYLCIGFVSVQAFLVSNLAIPSLDKSQMLLSCACIHNKFCQCTNLTIAMNFVQIGQESQLIACLFGCLKILKFKADSSGRKATGENQPDFCPSFM